MFKSIFSSSVIIPFSLIIICLFFAFGCTQEDFPLHQNELENVEDHNYPSKSNLTETDVKKYLNSAAISILHKISDTAFVNQVYNLAGDQLTGDYNALFYKINEQSFNDSFKSDLMSNYDNNLQDHSSATSSLQSVSIDDFSNNVFSSSWFLDDIINGLDIEGSTLFPQIYIHEYDVASQNSNMLPTVAVNYYDDDTIFGYRWDGSENIEVVEVDSMHAVNNEVWVVGFNEVIESYEMLTYFENSESKVLHGIQVGKEIIYPDITVGDPPPPDTVTVRTTCPYDPPIRGNVTHVKMMDPLESRWSGKSDVSIAYVHIDEQTGLNTDHIRTITNVKLERRDRGWQETFRLRLDNNSDKITCNEVVDFIIYEKDRKRSGLGKERKYHVTYESNGSSCESGNSEKNIIYYISKQNDYFVSSKYTRCAIEYDYPVLNQTYEWGLGERAGFAKLYFEED